MWRRAIGVGDGGFYYAGKQELAAVWSLLLGIGPPRLASTEGRMTGAANLQPSRSFAAALDGACAPTPDKCCLPIFVRSFGPCVRLLSTRASSPRRRGRSVSPGTEDSEEGLEKAQVNSSNQGRVEDRWGTDLVEGCGSEPEPEPEEWEEEDNAEPKIGDGGDGGGIVLGDVGWGELALSIANEVLRLHFDSDMQVFAFRISPRGYIYVRLDKLSNEYGCPTTEEIDKFSKLYNERLEESGEKGELPKDLAFEVSSPGAERLLKVPVDLRRFRDKPMVVHYVEEDRWSEAKTGVFLLESLDAEAGECVWKLADVRENRHPLHRGRVLNRKRRDWRLRVPLRMLNRVLLYVPLA